MFQLFIILFGMYIHTSTTCVENVRKPCDLRCALIILNFPMKVVRNE